jgi:hypothetical protein
MNEKHNLKFIEDMMENDDSPCQLKITEQNFKQE